MRINLYYFYITIVETDSCSSEALADPLFHYTLHLQKKIAVKPKISSIEIFSVVADPVLGRVVLFLNCSNTWEI